MSHNCHSREGGNPFTDGRFMDPRFREDDKRMRIALYHPEIPQNVGTIMRTCACFGVSLDIVYPIGFVWDDKRIKRAHMDYDVHTQVVRHDNFDQFLQAYPDNPMIILSTQAEMSLGDVIPDKVRSAAEPGSQADPIFVFGRESDGIRPEDEERLLLNPNSHKVRIPIKQRSLNLAVCVGVVFGMTFGQR
jgi:tRNA (cytidine/uridine-2'-O-)-methyltransferase